MTVAGNRLGRVMTIYRGEHAMMRHLRLMVLTPSVNG